MKELFEQDDEIRRIVKKEGLLKPSSDFTSRVMQIIEENKEHILVYEPLLSKKAWSVIFGGIIMVTMLCWKFFSGAPAGSIPGFPESIKKASQFINSIDLSVEFNTNAVLIVTLAMISMGILLLFDIWISNKDKKTAL